VRATGIPACADALGLDADALASETGLAMLAGGHIPAGAEPIAMAYAGHQFGNWVPSLGDGRAILLGEVIAPDGGRFDIHLKGAGRTPFSRGGDGKAVLGAVLREYIVSEAMAGLGIATTRALAAVTTGETVMRETPQQGAVLARVAASHIRVGTFQYFYGRNDIDGLHALLDHVIARHFPDAADAEIPALAVLERVMERQADLIAQWMQVGFIHGVMNTDNVSIAGETIDYGPCAFMDTFDPARVFSSIDQQGRYAYQNQPGIAHWNLAQLAQSLLPLIGSAPEAAAEQAQTTLDQFGALMTAAYHTRFAEKIGLEGTSQKAETMVKTLLDVMTKDKVDFTLAFRHLTQGAERGDFTDFRSLFRSELACGAWLEIWDENFPIETRDTAVAIMRRANPVFIARNHRVEQAIEAANQGDLSIFETLLDVLENPYADRPDRVEFEAPPRPDEVVTETFCGT